MTTIAFDGRFMVCDSQTTSGELKYDGGTKITRHHGTLIGTAGRKDDGVLFRKWFEDQSKPFPKEVDDFASILVGPDGKPYEITDKGVRLELPIPCAIGTGRGIALGAMRAGRSAKEAVEIAKEVDIYTGGTIHVEAAERRRR